MWLCVCVRLRAARRTAESAASRAVARGPTAKAQLFCKITAEQQQRSGSAGRAEAVQGSRERDRQQQSR